MSQPDYYDIAARRRADILSMIHRSGSGHTGGSLSSIDILVTLFYGVMQVRPHQPDWPDRDRFVLSKGHSVEGYLAVLADLGFFPKEELLTFTRYQSRLIGHPSIKVPGIEVCSGALGHGLSIAAGMALGARMTGSGWKTYVLMGDGEQAEGSIWEAAMAAAHYRLDNLVALIDRNRLQISGDTESVMQLESLAAKWQAFGWQVSEHDGHDIPGLVSLLKQSPDPAGRPHLVLARTVKGKGVSFMENQAAWHHKVPDQSQLQAALSELGIKETFS